MSIETVLRFAQLGLSAPILQSIDEIGYETPSEIQAQSIPPMIEGRDLLGQAQTGTGKTAAFALPILCAVDTTSRATQALVLTPTRELAIQVAEAIHAYGKHLSGLHVLPVYGGQHIGAQLRPLQRGVHIVVGTPGRIIDHLNRGTLKLNQLKTVVLDEADEMLRMGFIDDVDHILQQTPDTKQVALFSATMPSEVRRIADRHLKNPELIKIVTATVTVDTVKQSYLIAPWRQKMDAMTRILESADFNAMLVFVRTKVATLEVSEKLEARGYSCSPLNGDMTQPLRERTVQRLRDGSLDIVVATDVAARGLDVSRISHVVNFDIPNDTESYIHRIGRTGRAGREGEAISLVQPREKRMLRTIEKATGQSIGLMKMPSAEAVTDRRVAKFKQTVQETIESQDLDFFSEVVVEICKETEKSPKEVAAAIAFLVQQERPFQSADDTPDYSYQADSGAGKRKGRDNRDNRIKHDQRDRRDQREQREPREPRVQHDQRDQREQRDRKHSRPGPGEWISYKLDSGKDDGVEPRNIVGAITNETGLSGASIGRITMNDENCFIDIDATTPRSALEKLKDVQIFGCPLRASGTSSPAAPQRPSKKFGGKRSGPPPKNSGYPKGPKREKTGKDARAGKKKKFTKHPTKNGKFSKFDGFSKGKKAKAQLH